MVATFKTGKDRIMVSQKHPWYLLSQHGDLGIFYAKNGVRVIVPFNSLFFNDEIMEMWNAYKNRRSPAVEDCSNKRENTQVREDTRRLP